MISTLAEFKGFLGISGDTQDTELTRVLSAAESFLEKETGRLFEKAERTERKDGEGKEEIFLQNLPIVSITSVTIDDVEKTAADYKFDEDTGEFWHKDLYDFTPGKKNIVIVYQSGWITAAAPEDLKQAIYSVASAVWKKRGNEGVASESTGDYSISFELGVMDSIPSSVSQIVDSYRVKNV